MDDWRTYITLHYISLAQSGWSTRLLNYHYMRCTELSRTVRKKMIRKRDLRWFRKTDSAGAEMMCGGRLFQRRLPATGNARSPTVDSCVHRTTCCEDDNHRRWRQMKSFSLPIVGNGGIRSPQQLTKLHLTTRMWQLIDAFISRENQRQTYHHGVVNIQQIILNFPLYFTDFSNFKKSRFGNAWMLPKFCIHY